jgi:Fe-S cluster assembly iron-binding protein IscA
MAIRKLFAHIAHFSCDFNRMLGIRTGAEPNGSRIAVGFAVREEPDPGDMELEQHGFRIFVQDVLVEPLDGRVLDVREAAEGMELVFR